MSSTGTPGGAPNPFVLRPYQEQAIADIRAAFARMRCVLYTLPTGGGKTVTFSYVAYHAAIKGKRVLILAHRREIVDQISAALTAMGVEHGRIQPNELMTNQSVQIGMVQTVARRLQRIATPDLIVLDEAHHAVAGTWAAVLEQWPAAKVLGVTATPERLDGRGLREAGFQAMVLGPDVRELIDQGFLADYTYLAPSNQVDLTGLKKKMGDFVASELAERVDKRAITGSVIEYYNKHLSGRSAIVFCCLVSHAQHVAEQFREAGIPAASIDGSMTSDERKGLVESLRCGDIKILTSCDLISEGFDAPAVNGCIILRPTASFAMFRQQVGRCLRPKPDGSKAVISDHVHNVALHGLPDAPHEWSLDTKPKRKAPVRICKACEQVFPLNASADDCPDPGNLGCIFEETAEGNGAGRQVPREIAGALDIISPTPEWTNGINIRSARGKIWFELLRRAEGREDRLRNIQLIRGYKRGWVWHKVNDYRNLSGV